MNRRTAIGGFIAGLFASIWPFKAKSSDPIQPYTIKLPQPIETGLHLDRDVWLRHSPKTAEQIEFWYLEQMSPLRQQYWDAGWVSESPWKFATPAAALREFSSRIDQRIGLIIEEFKDQWSVSGSDRATQYFHREWCAALREQKFPGMIAVPFDKRMSHLTDCQIMFSRSINDCTRIYVKQPDFDLDGLDMTAAFETAKRKHSDYMFLKTGRGQYHNASEADYTRPLQTMSGYEANAKTHGMM